MLMVAMALLIGLQPTPDIASPPALNPRVARLRGAVAARPDDANLHFFLADAEAAAGLRDAALASLTETMRLGDGFLPPADRMTALQTDGAYRALYARLAARLPRVTNARRAYALTNPDFFPEGIAWDAQRRRLYLGSMVSGDVIAVDPARRRETRILAGRGYPVLGLTITPRGDLCMVETNGFLDSAQHKRINHLRCIRPDSGAMTRDVALDQAVQLNDLAVAPNGDVYLTDSGGGALWRVTPDDRAEKLADLPAANGVTLDGAGQAYVAHATGIARYRIATRQLEPRLRVLGRETIAAIDGLYWREGELIGVQNVTNPGRLIAMRINRDGAVDRVRTLQSHHHPDIAEPTTAAIAGRRIYWLARSEVSRLQPDGSIASPDIKRPALILTVPLSH